MDEDIRKQIALDRKRRLQLPYREIEYRPVSERIGDFHEVTVPFDAERAIFEASRCLQCPGISSCMKGCPAQNNIPLIMSHIEKGQFIEAARIFRQTSSFPEICGRVCPQEFLCEGHCNLKRQGKGIHIGQLEVFVTSYQRQHEALPIIKQEPTERKVAIVGGGPSGLACAEQLAIRGHQVTVFIMSSGVLLLSDNVLSDLAETGNVDISYCDFNATRMNIDKSSISLRVKASSQLDNALMVRDSDRVICL